MKESFLIRVLDHVAFDHLARIGGWGRDIPDVRAYVEKLESDFRERSEVFPLTFGMFSAIDAKIAALLTHISIILAVLASLYSNAFVGSLYWIFLALEIVVYLIATMLCLRCVRFGLPATTSTENHSIQAYEEIFKRRAIYNVESDTTIAATSVLVVIFLAHLIWS